MKNFFLGSLSPDDKSLILQLKGSCEFSLGGQDGLLIDETALPEALKALQAEVVAESQTELEGVIALGLGKKETVTSTIGLWQSAVGSSPYLKVVEEIFPGMGFCLWEQNKTGQIPLEKVSGPSVLIWSTPQKGGTYQDGNTGRPSVAFGIPLKEGNWWSPSEEGELIRVPENGHPIAEVVGDRVYILYAVVLVPRGPEIFREILKEVKFLREASPEEKARRAEVRIRERVERSRTAYVTECRKRFAKTVEGTRQKIEKRRADATRLLAEYVKALRETEGAERKLEQLLSCSGAEDQRYVTEFDNLLRVKGVKDVKAEPGVVRVFTDTLYCQDPRKGGKLHEIGAFCIDIHTEGGAGGVKWNNLTRQVGGHHAPHIGPNGPCWGNTAEAFAELLANHEYSALAMLAIQFVESVNTDDQWGVKIVNWPVASSKPATSLVVKPEEISGNGGPLFSLQQEDELELEIATARPRY